MNSRKTLLQPVLFLSSEQPLLLGLVHEIDEESGRLYGLWMFNNGKLLDKRRSPKYNGWLQREEAHPATELAILLLGLTKVKATILEMAR